jgi:hypothetical protein
VLPQQLCLLQKSVQAGNYTNLSDVEAVDSSLEKINQLSGMYEFRSTNLQSVKDRLMPFLWQDITELEAVCYKIVHATIRDATKLWE